MVARVGGVLCLGSDVVMVVYMPRVIQSLNMESPKQTLLR